MMKRLWVVLGLGVMSACATAPHSKPEGKAQAGSLVGVHRTFGEDTPSPRGGPGGVLLATAPDPIVTDGDKYHVLLENEHVRVLRYHDQPGARTRPHHHAEFVLYALSAFRRRLTFPDGSVKERDFKPGDVIWMPEQVHTGENVGRTDTDVILIENKLVPHVATSGPSPGVVVP